MRTYNLTFLIDGEKDIIFKAEYAHVEERENALFCSLKGEFFEKDQPYNPAMTYEMSNSSVTTRNINDILKDKYKFLVMTYYPEMAKRLFQKK